jgi:DNA-binding transcriptional regulator YiaG
LPICHLHIKGLRCPCPDYWITTQTAPTTPKTIGEHIRKRRLELHLQKDLARQLGVHMESLKNWERGVEQPMIRYIPRIIEFLGHDLEPEPDTLPKRLVYARRRLGLTQDNLAKALKVDSVSIWCWEKGQVEPPAFRLQQLNQMLAAKSIPIRLSSRLYPNC